jgi:hypothetical protein
MIGQVAMINSFIWPVLFQPAPPPHQSADWLQPVSSWPVPSAPSTVSHAANPHFCWSPCCHWKSFRVTEEIVKNIYSNKALTKMQLYKISRKVQRGETSS